MNTLIQIILSTTIISLASLVGLLTLGLKEKFLNKILFFLISLSAGALMGGAFLHLIPEGYEKFPSKDFYLFILLGFILFFIIEKFFHWRHCHEEHCDIHTFGYMNLVGDALHNFIDGLIIAGTFLTDVNLGLITSLVIALHEIPQEIGDFGVLLYAGFSRKKALILNLLIALVAVLGGLIGYSLAPFREILVKFSLPMAAGGFIYIAASDLMPELKKEKSLKKSVVSFLFFIFGLIIIYLSKHAE